MKLTPDASPDTLQYITMMESSIKRLTDMIEKILDTEAMDGRRDIISLEPVDVSEIMDTLATRFEITARQKSIGIITRIDQGVFALADRLYTEQVFENLISNAIKFSPFNKKIFLSLTTRDNKVIGCVRDQGPGLSDEDKTKLFGKYQKLSARPTGNEISTGLGLSIVKKFVESMHGEIWCESQAGNGAGFFVALSVP